jgi:hypothetical protein
MCLEAEEPLVFMRLPEEEGGGDNMPFVGAGAGASAGVGVGVGDDGEPEDKIRSDESRTAESTSTSAIRCNASVTSAGFQSSSSTNFADCDIRAWWNVCKNTFAYTPHYKHASPNKKLTSQKEKEKERTWLTTAPLSPTIILLQITSHPTTNLHDSLKNTKKLPKSSDACCSDL